MIFLPQLISRFSLSIFFGGTTFALFFSSLRDDSNDYEIIILFSSRDNTFWSYHPLHQLHGYSQKANSSLLLLSLIR